LDEKIGALVSVVLEFLVVSVLEMGDLSVTESDELAQALSQSLDLCLPVLDLTKDSSETERRVAVNSLSWSRVRKLEEMLLSSMHIIDENLATIVSCFSPQELSTFLRACFSDNELREKLLNRVNG
jgi:hypothetical protein